MEITSFLSNAGYWLLAILMFGVLIMLHELGHFTAARLSGVTVVEFAIGLGPKIVSRKAKSGVTYSWRALPFGGYCRFVGDGEDEEDLPDAYQRQKIWKRSLISIAGPLTNVLLCIVLLFLICFTIGLPIGPEPVVDDFIPGLPAESAGFEVGDRIIAVNGEEISTTEQASRIITDAGDLEIIFTVERDGAHEEIAVTPQWSEDEEGGPRYMIGIQYRMGTEPVRLNFVSSVRYASVLTGDMARVIFDSLRDLFILGQGVEELSGPIGAVTVVKQQTQEGGLFTYTYLAAMISVNLGLFNMLPIPGLDGSKLVFLLVEKLRGKPLDSKKEGVVTLAGFALLIGLMAIAMYQDITRLIQ